MAKKKDLHTTQQITLDDLTDKKILTIEDIAERVGCSVKKIRRETASGALKTFRKGNKLYIKGEDYISWKNNPTDEAVFDNTSKKDSAQINRTKKAEDEVNWTDISAEMDSVDAWKDHSQLKNLNFIDLFSGAGGLSCGLVMSGMRPIGSVEIMPQAVETYKHNFSRIEGFCENVTDRDIREEEVKNDLIASLGDRHIHLIAGGFPCQGFSMAGNRIITDPRNSLYTDMLEIVKRVKPDFVLMENVEGLRSMLDGKIEEKIISDYAEIGYKINVTVLNAADYGVPQHRRRVIFIGNRIGAVNYHPKPIYTEDTYKTVGDAIAKYVDMPENKDINHIIARTSPEMKKRLEAIPIGKSLYANYSDAWKKVDWNKPSCTVKENHGGVNVHPILNRVMTPRELAALQSFPEDFIFKGAKKWQLVQIGNAVPCLLGKAIGLAIQRSYTEKNNNTK